MRFARGGGTVVWLTGLPCAGKTTIARILRDRLPDGAILDGDEVRKTLNRDLGFSPEDRAENLRRITEMAVVLLDSCRYAIVAVVSPTRAVRAAARKRVESAGAQFVEVFVDAPLDTCRRRDVKGMYARAAAGDIPDFTGVGAPYEAPAGPEVSCPTANETAPESARRVLAYLGREDPQTAHAMFIGRWSPFHKGHWAIMERVRLESPDRPLLILVRDTSFDYWPAYFRRRMVEAAMREMGVPATVLVVPDIDTVNWGRGVGYEPRLVDVDKEIQGISGSEIRDRMANGDGGWEELLCPGVAEVLREAAT